MKNNKLRKETILYPLVFVVIVYLLGCFVNLGFDPSYWSTRARETVSVFMGIGVVLGILFSVIGYVDSKPE